MTKQQPTNPDGTAKLKTTSRTKTSTIDVHNQGGYRPGWNNTYDTSQKPAATRLTPAAQAIIDAAKKKSE